MAGVEVDLEVAICLRHELASDISFNGIAKWFDTAREALFLMRAISADLIFSESNFIARRRLVLIGVAHLLHPLPQLFSFSIHKPELTLLTWNIHAKNADDNFLQNRREIARCNSNRAMSRMAYSVAVRGIQKWLIRSMPRGTLENSFLKFNSNRFAGISDQNSSVIAFILFRNCLELSPNFSSMQKFRPSGFRMDHGAPVRLYPYTDREPRLAYYAIFFAIYAGIYWRVEKLRGAGQLAEITIRDLESLILKFILRSENRVAGGVIFPTIPGLPIPSFLSSNFDDARKSLTSSAGFHGISSRFS